MTHPLSGRTALVTGAAGNLGQAVARALAAAGASLVLCDIDAGALAKAAPPVSPAPLLLPVNLLDAADVTRAAQAALAHAGRIDILSNIAGGFAMGDPVHATADDTWRRMLDLNAGTVLNTARAIVPAMLAAGGGRIVNVAAMAGVAGRPDMGAYSVSKSAVMRLTESMAQELRHKGINVNAVMPSIIDTPQNRAAMPGADPAQWVAPEALADVIVFLASDAARAVHGACIPVTGLS